MKGRFLLLIAWIVLGCFGTHELSPSFALENKLAPASATKARCFSSAIWPLYRLRISLNDPSPRKREKEGNDFLRQLRDASLTEEEALLRVTPLLDILENPREEDTPNCSYAIAMGLQLLWQKMETAEAKSNFILRFWASLRHARNWRALRFFRELLMQLKPGGFSPAPSSQVLRQCLGSLEQRTQDQILKRHLHSILYPEENGTNGTAPQQPAQNQVPEEAQRPTAEAPLRRAREIAQRQNNERTFLEELLGDRRITRFLQAAEKENRRRLSKLIGALAPSTEQRLVLVRPGRGKRPKQSFILQLKPFAGEMGKVQTAFEESGKSVLIQIGEQRFWVEYNYDLSFVILHTVSMKGKILTTHDFFLTDGLSEGKPEKGFALAFPASSGSVTMRSWFPFFMLPLALGDFQIDPELLLNWKTAAAVYAVAVAAVSFKILRKVQADYAPNFDGMGFAFFGFGVIFAGMLAASPFLAAIWLGRRLARLLVQAYTRSSFVMGVFHHIGWRWFFAASPDDLLKIILESSVWEDWKYNYTTDSAFIAWRKPFKEAQEWAREKVWTKAFDLTEQAIQKTGYEYKYKFAQGEEPDSSLKLLKKLPEARNLIIFLLVFKSYYASLGKKPTKSREALEKALTLLQDEKPRAYEDLFVLDQALKQVQGLKRPAPEVSLSSLVEASL